MLLQNLRKDWPLHALLVLSARTSGSWIRDLAALLDSSLRHNLLEIQQSTDGYAT